jgi:diguanylate cyclase (GGDEF)-like protein/PAS domain S-box-containing protein
MGQEEIVQRLEALFKNSTEAIVLFDRNHCVVDINQRFVELFGYELAEIKGLDVDRVMEMGKANSSNRGYTEAVISGKKVEAEATRYSKDGLPIEVLVKGVPIIIDGEFTGGYGIYTDITARKRVEANLRESEARNRALLDAIPDLMLIFNRDGVFLDYNVNDPEKLFFSPELFLNHHVSDVLHPRLAQTIMTGLNLVFTGRQPQLFEFSVELGGKLRHFESRLVLCGEERALAILRDITEAKHVEDALRKSEERYREILASIEEGYYEADLAGNIIFCNDAAGRLIGYAPEELLGMNYKDLYRNPAAAYNTFHQVFLTGEPDRGFTMEMIRKDGTPTYGELSISLIKDKDGAITGFRGVARDITERIHFEERLKYLSLHDHLTGLYNRTFFEEELNRLSISREYPLSIITADLDELKLVNDTMGHDKGDQMLKDAAAILKKSLRSSDILARVGGDEFSVILPRTDAETAESIAARIRENIDQHRKKARLPLGLSLGLATSDTEDIAIKELYKRADDLMYRDKLYHSTKARNKNLHALLVALEEKDFITEGHALKLEELCRKVGEKINLSTGQLSDLALLAQVHDLGKVGIPDEILFKRESLTREEWKTMRQHPEKGYRIALSCTDLSGVADFILKHHERWDGSGYPLGIKGEEIPVECRILAIADAYDAMTKDRPYSKARSHQEAVDELKRCAGTQFDPELVQVFLSLY